MALRLGSINLKKIKLESIYNAYFGMTPREQTFALVGAAVVIVLVVVLPVFVASSRLVTWRFAWAAALERAFVRLLGPLSPAAVCTLTVASALAEEAFFRAAMQPSLGLVATSLIFGLLHFGPGRTFLPWTAMAIGMGFAFGGLAAWSGSLVAPVACHATINGLNLWAIALKARPGRASR